MRFGWNNLAISKRIENTNRAALLRMLSWAQYEQGVYLDGMPRSVDDALWKRVEPECSHEELMARVLTDEKVNIRYQRRGGNGLLSVHMDGLTTELIGPRYLMKMLFPQWEQQVRLSVGETEEMARYEDIVSDFRTRPLTRWRGGSNPETFPETYAEELLQLPPLGASRLNLSLVKDGNVPVPGRKDAQEFTEELVRVHTAQLVKTGPGNIFVANLHSSRHGCLYFIRDTVDTSPLYVIQHLDYISDGGSVTWRLYQAGLWPPSKYHCEVGMGWKTLDPKSANSPNAEAFQELILARLYEASEQLSERVSAAPPRGAQLHRLRPDSGTDDEK